MKFKHLAIVLAIVFSSALTTQGALARSMPTESIWAEKLFQILAPAIGPASLVFGDQWVGVASPLQTVTITNNDASDLVIGTLSVTGDFSLSNDLCSGQTIAQSGTCTFEVVFSPLSIGSKSDAVTIPSNAASSPDSVTLSGTGISPAMGLTPTSLDFGNQLVGASSAAQTVTVTNTGTTDLIIGTLSNTGEFALSADLCSGQTIVPGGICTFDVPFSPLSIGGKSGTVSILSNAASSPDSVTLSGTGISPALSVSPTSLDFANQLVGTVSSAQTVSVTNTGTADLLIGTLSNTGEFTLSANLCSGQTIAPSGTCTFDVAFSPLSIGAKTDAVSIPSNAASSPDSVTLSGSGVEADTWYVATTGSDVNDCLAVSTPCATINGAIGKATSGKTVMVAIGTYTAASGLEVVLIDKSITLSGGWNATFATQSGRTTIDGGGARRGITTAGTSVFVDHFKIQNGFDGSQGGGIYNSDSLVLSNSIVSGNVSGWTGGGIENNGTLTINTTTISGNTADLDGPGSGGGIDNFSGVVTLNNSTVSSNTTYNGFGSGISTNGTVILNNSTVSGNNGEGIYTFVGTVMLNSSTISKNQSQGIINQAGHVSLKNTIIAGNGLGDCYNDVSYSGTVTSQGYNLIGNKAGCAIRLKTGDQFGTSAYPINPLLGSLRNNGGATFTHALLGGSPAINAGNPSTPGSGGNACLATDQRGVARPEGSACDIGAYEGHFTVVSSIKRANPSPTGAPQVHFVVTFSEAVRGVDTTAPFNDFSLTTNGVTGASISSVSGSGKTYTVTVNTGVGNGAIRLNVVDNDSILDISGKALGGPGVGNGNFGTGENYVIWLPRVVSITRSNLDPTAASQVHFKVVFSEPVTGVDAAMPFNDFSLTTTGVTGVSISAVSGFGNTYNVTVNTGDGNGSVRLNVVDNDSILDSSSNRLGGTGMGNGNFATGQIYTVLSVPTPQSPAGKIVDATPTYQWTKIPGATQYQYQLLKGETPVYTKTLAASTCITSVCFDTPVTSLGNAVYKWNVRAMVSGVWKSYSVYKLFTVAVSPPPNAGFWKGANTEYSEFYVTPDRANVDNFAIYVTVYACGINNQKLTYNSLAPIVNSQFSHRGSYYFGGIFTSSVSANGYFGMNNYYWPGCGYLNGGPFFWKDAWVNSAQSLVLNTRNTPVITVTPALNVPSNLFYLFDLVKP